MQHKYLKTQTPTFLLYMRLNDKGKGKGFRYRPGLAQRVGRGIALVFHDCGNRRG